MAIEKEGARTAWLNNFSEFERKQTRANRLVINFRALEGDRNLKVCLNKPVRIPSKFLAEENAAKLEAHIQGDDILSQYPLEKKQFGKFYVYAITLPNDPEILQRLKKGSRFQMGNYDKLLRLGGFFPDRKVSSRTLESLAQSGEEIELDSLGGFQFLGFPTADELASYPYVIIDIEKPLWKHDRERVYLHSRERLIKREKRFQKQKEKSPEEERKHEKRLNAIANLEKRLTIDIEGAGEIRLYDERFDADISFVSTIWRNIWGKMSKELYVLDPNKEFADMKPASDYDVFKFGREEELIDFLISRFKERKPMISFGHNQVYDITQIRDAADESKRVFDPAVLGVKPKRDFVRSFIQRLREDMIYLDTLWLSRIFFPYLQQRKLGTSLKLEDVAKFCGIDFKKSHSHEELRGVEVRRLAGATIEIRKKAMQEMLDYSSADVDADEGIIGTMGYKAMRLVTDLKRVLPFCTLSEIAFSPNCMAKYHDYLHFQRIGNIRYHKYTQKQREDELQIFKKRFASAKKKMLEWALEKQGVSPAKTSDGKEVHEFYMPIEEWLSPLAFRLCPQLKEVADRAKPDKEQYLAFLQYEKIFMRDILADYYFARREAKNFLFALKHAGVSETDARNEFYELEQRAEPGELDALLGSFRYLKNHFRSIYVALDGKSRKLVRPTRKNLDSIEYPEIMKKDADLFLLRERQEEIVKMLSPAKQRDLKAYLTNFEKFDELVKKLGSQLGDYASNPMNFLYTYIQYNRAQGDRTQFKRRYGFQVAEVTKTLADSYLLLANGIRASGASLIEARGDYLFMAANCGPIIPSIPGAYYIRSLDDYVYEKKGKGEDEEDAASRVHQLTLPLT